MGREYAPSEDKDKFQTLEEGFRQLGEDMKEWSPEDRKDLADQIRRHYGLPVNPEPNRTNPERWKN